jgi:hypothetical protein
MPLLSLCDSAGARRNHDGIRRCRLVIDCVDLEKADVSLKTNGLITLTRRRKHATAKFQVPFQSESYKLQPDRASLHPEHQPVLGLMSTPSYKRHFTQEPNYINILSLPPSSPIVSSSQGSDAVAFLGEDNIGNADPFGFLAVERKLKARWPRPSIMSYPARVSEEHSSLGEENHSREAFASQTSSIVKKHEVFSASVGHKRRIAVSMSPSPPLLINRSNTSSPCRKAMKCRPTTRKEVIGGVEKSKDKDSFDGYEWKPTTSKLEALPLEHLKGDRQRNRKKKRKVHKPTTKRVTRQPTSAGSVQSALLSHLTGEERKVGDVHPMSHELELIGWYTMAEVREGQRRTNRVLQAA